MLICLTPVIPNFHFQTDFCLVHDIYTASVAIAFVSSSPVNLRNRGAVTGSRKMIIFHRQPQQTRDRCGTPLTAINNVLLIPSNFVERLLEHLRKSTSVSIDFEKIDHSCSFISVTPFILPAIPSAADSPCSSIFSDVWPAHCTRWNAICPFEKGNNHQVSRKLPHSA